MIGKRAADTLSTIVLDQDDPELITSGLPAYLLFVDGLIAQHPQNVNLLSAGAQLFAVYGSRFAAPDHAVVLTAKARRYGERAICIAHTEACGWSTKDYDTFVAELGKVERKQIGALYSYAVGWLSNLQATSEDWGAVADLPRVEAVLERALALDETYEHGAIHGYLGILGSLRPPALGGKPDRGARALRARNRAVWRKRFVDQSRIRAPLRASRVRSGAARPFVDGSTELAHRGA